MAQNKVQYQRGLSMPEFFDGYGSAQRPRRQGRPGFAEQGGLRRSGANHRVRPSHHDVPVAAAVHQGIDPDRKSVV